MSSTTNGNHLRSERHDGVAVLILDNPAQRNAMSDQMTAAWVDAVEELAQDRSVRAVMVTGEGTAFCSGGNTSWITSEPEAEVDHLRTRMIAFYRAWLSIRALEVPGMAATHLLPNVVGQASPRTPRSRPGTPSLPCATAATATSRARCSGRPSPSRSPWPPQTCTKVSPPPGRSDPRRSPVGEAR
ncbi:MAG: enoyl-CoA hydratase/isomerase family protein [Actinomycetota bacterium]|nr:enoyl-CoA hydratase/isomerase family protein [Actinomycetota bacterium]